MILGVETFKTPVVMKFFLNASSKIKRGLKVPNAHLGVNIKYVDLDSKVMLVYNYKLLGSGLSGYFALFITIPILIFKGLTSWLLLPLTIYKAPDIIRWLSYWLLKKGLSKEGYSSKIKMLSKDEIIERGVL